MCDMCPWFWSRSLRAQGLSTRRPAIEKHQLLELRCFEKKIGLGHPRRSRECSRTCAWGKLCAVLSQLLWIHSTLEEVIGVCWLRTPRKTPKTRRRRRRRRHHQHRPRRRRPSSTPHLSQSCLEVRGVSVQTCFESNWHKLTQLLQRTACAETSWNQLDRIVLVSNWVTHDREAAAAQEERRSGAVSWHVYGASAPQWQMWQHTKPAYRHLTAIDHRKNDEKCGWTWNTWNVVYDW